MGDIDGNLTNLGMIAKETLRLQPPASIIARRLSEPVEADGNILPAGSSVDIISIWWLHRDSEHRENPEPFDPVRSEEKYRNRHPYSCTFLFLPVLATVWARNRQYYIELLKPVCASQLWFMISRCLLRKFWV